MIKCGCALLLLLVFVFFSMVFALTQALSLALFLSYGFWQVQLTTCEPSNSGDEIFFPLSLRFLELSLPLSLKQSPWARE